MSKKSRICRCLLWTCLAIVFQNCIYYKTVTLPVNQSALRKYQVTKPIWTIRDVNHRTDQIYAVILRNDSILGKVSPEVFIENSIKGARPKDYLHLYTNAAEFLNEVKIPLSDVTSATTDEKNLVKMIGVDALLVFLTIIIFFR